MIDFSELIVFVQQPLFQSFGDGRVSRLFRSDDFFIGKPVGKIMKGRYIGVDSVDFRFVYAFANRLPGFPEFFRKVVAQAVLQHFYAGMSIGYITGCKSDKQNAGNYDGIF